MIFFVFSVVALCFMFIKYHWSRWPLYKFAYKLNGPPALPLLGNALMFAGKTNELFNRIDNLLQQNKHPLRLWLGPYLVAIFSDVKHVEILLSSTKLTYKSNLYVFLQEIGGGEGLITASGPVWKEHRKIIQHFFTLKYVTNSVPTIQKKIDILLTKMRAMANKGQVDVLDCIHRCCFDMVAEIIHGFEANTQSGDNSDAIHAFEDFYDNLFEQLVKPWLYPKFVYNLTPQKQVRDRINKHIDIFLSEIIDNSKERIKVKEPEEEILTPIVDQINRYLLKYPNAMSRTQIKDHLFTLFAASEDTVSITAAMCCRCFGMYPEYQDKVAEEIKDVFGETPREVRWEDLHKLKYLEMCIKEVLRLQTIAPFIIRRTTENMDFGDHSIPVDCEVLIPIYRMHRNPAHFDVPLHFYPDHFLPEAVDKRHPFAYLPFSAGPRVCIGKFLAMQMVKILMANILQHFRFEAPGKFPDISFRTDISVRPLDGYKMSIFNRT